MNGSKASYLQLFGVFAKIGSFTIGGGYAMIPIIQDELVRRGWIDEEEFPDIIALAQTAPGLLAVNTSILAGYRVGGAKGCVVATIGSILPSFLFILAIAMVFTSFKDNPTVESIFRGIRPVVVALIAVPMINMARKNCRTPGGVLLAAATAVLVAFLKVSPIYILIAVIGYSVVSLAWKGRKQS
ncbi:MAG: chromate transporter [Bacteroidales bacterium]|nr:chromate transporter [Bacteroidales bacterium]